MVEKKRNQECYTALHRVTFKKSHKNRQTITLAMARAQTMSSNKPRTKLPSRRPNVTFDFETEGRAYTVTIGFDPRTATPGEIFISDARTGSSMDATLNDASILASLALQFGRTPQELAAAMSRLGNLHQSPEGAEPASPVGAALDILCRETVPQETPS